MFAKVPRIILDKPLAEAWGIDPRITDKDGALIGYQKLWRMDDDGWRYFDFLQPLANMPGHTVDANFIDATLQPARNLVISVLEGNQTDPRIIRKYEWMARYLNTVIGEYPACTLESIDI